MDKLVGSKVSVLFAGLIFAILIIPAASADTQVYVWGKIFHEDGGVDYGPVGDADIIITCDINGVSVQTKSDNTGCDDIGGPVSPCGNYFILHPDCPVDETVTVKAVKGSMSGSAKGVVGPFGASTEVGISWVDVPIAAPEIVALVAGIMILAPGFAYVLNKRKK